jgi:murein DD-endopeptidase MepM/ murein hydrolase activator NlpD
VTSIIDVPGAARVEADDVPIAVAGSSPELLSRRARRIAQAKAARAASAPHIPQAPIEEAHIAEVAVAEVAAVEVAAVEVVSVPEVTAVEVVSVPEPELRTAEPDVAAPVPRSDVDVFAQASGAFGFAPVGESMQPAEGDEPVQASVSSIHKAPRRRIRRRLAAAGASLGVMGVAGLIAVSMTLPASAVAAVQGGDGVASASLVAPSASTLKKVDKGEIQAYVASDVAQGESLARSDAYSTISLLDVAAEENIKFSDSLYTNDPNAAIQWPFMVGVAMSSPFGMRNGRMHEGIDLVPGNGATIQAIADGTVREATESGGAYGVTIYIDHIIDGKLITSHYAHMQHGSMLVHTGDKVKVGQALGRVGTTGRSTGPHLHFELIVNGSRIDPLPWLRANAGRYSY